MRDGGPKALEVWDCSRRAASLLEELVVLVLLPDEGGSPFITGAEDPVRTNNAFCFKKTFEIIRCYSLHGKILPSASNSEHVLGARGVRVID